MPLLVAAAYGLPGRCIPQWIELGTTNDEGKIMIDYNSLKRDGQRVGFTLSKVHRSSDDSEVLLFGLIVSVGLACLRVRGNGQESPHNQF